MIQARSRRLPALTALREEDMSPKCDASSRRKLGGPVVGEFQLGIRARSSEPVGRQLKAVIVWDDVGHWRSVYMPAILKLERSPTLSDRLWEFSWTSQEGEQRHEEQRQVEQPRVEQQKIEVEQPKVEQRKEEKEQPKAESVRRRGRERRSNSPKRRKRENPRSRKKSRKRERRKKTSHNNRFLVTLDVDHSTSL